MCSAFYVDQMYLPISPGPGSLFTRTDSVDYTTLDVYAKCLQNRNNITALDSISAPPWVSSPEVRGTPTILWSSIVTIVACVYTALHLNIKRHKDPWSIIATKTKWVAIALLAPEILIYSSATQFLQARRWRDRFREALGNVGKSEPLPEKVRTWCLTQTLLVLNFCPDRHQLMSLLFLGNGRH